MPLLDHFRGTLAQSHQWSAFHSGWASQIVGNLNQNWLPKGFIAQEQSFIRRFEIDIATYGPTPRVNGHHGDGPTTATKLRTWAPPATTGVMVSEIDSEMAIHVYSLTGGKTLVGAIEIVSEGNKDRPSHRRAFAMKCATYARRGVSVVVVDIVTTRRSNLHNLTMRMLRAPEELKFANEVQLYSSAYRPVSRGKQVLLELWNRPLTLGDELPTMPLRLTGDRFVPVELATTYAAACRFHNIE